MYRGFCLSYSIFVTDLIIKKIKMKKNLLSICAILVATATLAQQANTVELPNESLTKGYSTMSTSPNFTPSSASTAPQSIWEDDCSDISTWNVTNASTLGYGWAIEMDPNATPAGGALTPMASSSASNGYMMISSDALGGTSDNDGTIISTEFTNATPIDLTMYLNVQLTFQHNFRWWNDTRIVRISPDNGVTWVDLDVITDDAGYSYPAQSSDNPQMSTYDISSIAGGMSEVLVQFYYNDGKRLASGVELDSPEPNEIDGIPDEVTSPPSSERSSPAPSLESNKGTSDVQPTQRMRRKKTAKWSNIVG